MRLLHHLFPAFAMYLVLTGCCGGVDLIRCPALVTYDHAFNDGLADELQAAQYPPRTTAAVGDYIALRDACKAQKEITQ
jgi:hypothetical protein